ncbi:hypothetical protein NQ317_005104 [Molorchus minor]|uniref:CCDC66 domain-containing protein n=1 Tax=Molorchus minor TaxID=1323400 RepID=A0ABQ9JGA2_9CUCU|nr:hypothetical protein NQ317_005104 [Molorchus minor]
MSTFYSLSLVERKKLQWAKEREELASLSTPWGPADQNFNKQTRRYASPNTSMLNGDYIRKAYRENNRRSSLPPLYKNQYNSYDRFDREKELGGETSGYGSDNPNQTPECGQSNWHQTGYESSSSDRPKWGDKGVGVGKFWQPKDETFEKISQAHEPPNWVKRGLQDGEIVVANTSPAESPEQRYDETERPYTGSSYSVQRTFIRGQNIPIDSVELAEREKRRQLAMAHQEAVRQQLEERERKRREERERRIKEEQEEDIRIEREQEQERQRKERELILIREKQERERKRKEAIQEAIEYAQKTAILEKNKLINTNENDNINQPDTNDNHKVENRNNSMEQLNNRILTTKSEMLNNEINNNLNFTENIPRSPRPVENLIDNKPLPPTATQHLNNQHTNNRNNISNVIPITTPLCTPRTDSLALMVQTPLETLHNVQYALLVPTTPYPIQFPVNVTQVDRSCNTSRTENRVLTPTQFRNRNKGVCDSSTQTEESDFGRTTTEIKERIIREKLTNLELSYENRNRKERRSRSESLGERPKWDANRPPTRYLKQSEKDPLYQRRKLRQKNERQSYRKKNYVEKRHARALWSKDDHVFTRNIRMYQTEIIPLESDKDQIYYKTPDCCCICKCDRRKNSKGSVNVDILKIERASPREDSHYKTIETSDAQDCSLDDTNTLILNKLSSLQNVIAKLDDFLNKKKDSVPILDLSKTTCNSQEDFKKLMEHIPDFKIKPERVAPDQIKVKEKHFRFKSGKKDLKVTKEKYAFMDPLPAEMKSLKIEELAAVSIDWKMLTTLRPKSKINLRNKVNYFRLVELGKLQNKSRAQEKRQFQIDPQIRKSKNKSGIVEMRAISCAECGEDFCNGKSCIKLGYDALVRIPEVPEVTQKIASPQSGHKTKRKVKRRSRSKSKTKRKDKSKSPKRSPTKNKKK